MRGGDGLLVQTPYAEAARLDLRVAQTGAEHARNDRDTAVLRRDSGASGRRQTK